MKQFTLSIPFIYALFSNEAKMVYEEENIFLKSSEGISYSVTEKPKMKYYKGKKVAYFNYSQALGHFLTMDETKTHFIYCKTDLIKNENRKNNLLVCSELSNIDDVSELLSYFSYNGLVSVSETNKLKILLSLKEDFSQRWFVINLNNNAQGFMLFLANSDEIMGLAASFCINKAIFNQLLNYSLENIDHPYINMMHMYVENIPYQEIPLFFGEYDNIELSTIYNSISSDEIFIKEFITSSMYFSFNFNPDDSSILIKSNESDYASKFLNIENTPNCIRINNESEYKLLLQKSIQLLDDNLVEVDFKTFFDYVKNIHEYKNEDYQNDLAYTWGLGGHFYLYKINNNVVGGGVIQYESIHYCYVSYIFTIEKYRHKGYGSKLVKAITALGYTNTNKRIILIVIDKELIPFYEKCGFEVICGVDITSPINE